MIVKQVSIDIEVNDSNIDMATIIEEFLEKKGFMVWGTDQIDMSEQYDYSKYLSK